MGNQIIYSKSSRFHTVAKTSESQSMSESKKIEFEPRCYDGKIRDNKDTERKFIFTYHGIDFQIIKTRKIPSNGTIARLISIGEHERLLRTIRRHQFILHAQVPINCKANICGYISNGMFYSGSRIPIDPSITLVANSIEMEI